MAVPAPFGPANPLTRKGLLAAAKMMGRAVPLLGWGFLAYDIYDAFYGQEMPWMRNPVQDPIGYVKTSFGCGEPDRITDRAGNGQCLYRAITQIGNTNPMPMPGNLYGWRLGPLPPLPGFDWQWTTHYQYVGPQPAAYPKPYIPIIPTGDPLVDPLPVPKPLPFPLQPHRPNDPFYRETGPAPRREPVYAAPPIVSPRSGTMPRAHQRVRPDRNTREKKGRWASPAAMAAFRRIQSLLRETTEFGDLIDALWEALPKELRTKNASLQDKVADLWAHGYTHMDINAALKNVVVNMVEDEIIGRMLGLGQKAVDNLGLKGAYKLDGPIMEAYGQWIEATGGGVGAEIEKLYDAAYKKAFG